VIRTLVYVVYVVFWLMVVRVVLRAIARLFDSGTRTSAAGRPSVRPAEDLVRDRVCNTHVPRSRALVANIDGHEEYFCSKACRDRARAAVARVS
jgi:YHS domain-containing protein